MSIISDIFAGGAEGVFKGLKDLIGTFKADPLEIAKLEAGIQQAEMQYSAVAQAAVNATMQEEAKSEHWLQWSWRPVVGFTFAGTILNNYVFYSYFAKYGMVQITIPDNVWLAILAILGAAAYTRGQEKIARLNNGSK